MKCDLDRVRLEFEQFADLAGAQVCAISKRKEFLVALGEPRDGSPQVDSVGCFSGKILGIH